MPLENRQGGAGFRERLLHTSKEGFYPVGRAGVKPSRGGDDGFLRGLRVVSGRFHRRRIGIEQTRFRLPRLAVAGELDLARLELFLGPRDRVALVVEELLDAPD